MPEARIGDTVRVKRGEATGKRGVIYRLNKAAVVVNIEGSDERVTAQMEEITNLSLAARRAWLSMPKRQVGRPIGTRLCDRISVTIRIDRTIWNEFRKLEAVGKIEDRTAWFNRLLRSKLAALKRI